MAAAHFVGLNAFRRSPQGSALPRSTLGFMLPSASRTETCIDPIGLLSPANIHGASGAKNNDFAIY